MNADRFLEYLRGELQQVREAGLYKAERVLTSPQNAWIETTGTPRVVNLCANNYLGLADDPAVIAAAHAALDRFGFGMASVRFICGTQSIHKDLERRLSQFLGTDDTILYSSCFDANGGLFETLLGPDDAVISDALNHASIIDGVRLCKAKRFRYANNDMADLERQLQAARDARFRLIATDGVFSMDGVVADLAAVCELADRYDALVMVDDSHAVGFVGPDGRGTPAECGVAARVDIVTGTLGKALGGAAGGYTAGRKEIVEWLRQRSRPYLFSNSLPPPIAAATIAVLEQLTDSVSGRGATLRSRLQSNMQFFRSAMERLGFRLLGRGHAIIPVLLGEAKLAGEMAAALLQEGVYVIGFSYPVVPQGQARIRTQMSAAHTREELEFAVAAFAKVGRSMKVIP